MKAAPLQMALAFSDKLRAIPASEGKSMNAVLAGKVALVTGASSGIGEGIALGLAEAGAAVALCARRAERLQGLAARIEAGGGKTLVLAGDVVDADFAASAVQQTIDHFGQLDILVNSAGIIQLSAVENADLDEYRRVMDVNVMATLYTCRAAIPHMKARGTGDIVNITSQAGRKVAPIVNSYSASKHAANALTEGLRREVGEHGVRVSILMPGATQSEVAENMSDDKAKEFMRHLVSMEGVVLPQDIADTVVLMVSLPRRAHISEVTVRPTSDVTG
jgi:NADP-dependent 3-hydroxy acid dehydrogenase YdfG